MNTSITQAVDLGEAQASLNHSFPTEALTINQERSHLLCLNQHEALMLFGLLQAALRHEPTRLTVLSNGEYKRFHRQLSQALAEGINLPQTQS